MPKERTFGFGDFKGMTVSEAINQDREGVGRLLLWLEKKYDPHHKFAAQNRALIDEVKQKLAMNAPTHSAAPQAAPQVQGDTQTLLRQLNVNLQVVITLLADVSKKMGQKTDEYGADMEIPF